MKILHVSTEDFRGGAARAAYRIHRALVKSGIDSRMRVLFSGTGDERVKQGLPPHSFARRVAKMFRQRWINHTRRAWRTENPVIHTFGETGSGLVDELNKSDADILNLHWVSNMLSVKEIGLLRKPIVWTMHDMWAFCGGEHYAPDDENARFRCGYCANNRTKGERGPDLNRRTWYSKLNAWAQQRFTIISPSHWLAECARQSVLFSKWPVHVIPNPIDMDVIWRPINRNAARTVLNLPLDKKLILFGADGGVVDPRKGADLLREVVLRVATRSPGEIELLIYGQSKVTEGDIWPCPVHWLGVIRDDRILTQAYSAADVMVVPSRQDNCPNSAIEAQACGTPVATFNIGGLPDIVTHRETGWLANAFDTIDLAEGILWLLDDETRHSALSAAARKQAVERYSEPYIAWEYAEIYERINRNELGSK